MNPTRLLASLALAAAHVAATPSPQFCTTQEAILGIYGGAALATSWCSGYLSSHGKTITSTSTQTLGKKTVTITPSALTSTTTTTISIDVTSYVTASAAGSTTTATITVTSAAAATCMSTDTTYTPSAATAMAKRANEAALARRDSASSAAPASSTTSSAAASVSPASPALVASFCACLGLPTPTTTVTLTKTKTLSTITSTASVGAPKTVTVSTTTTVSHIVSQAATVQAGTAVVTETVTYTQAVQTNFPGLFYHVWANDYDYSSASVPKGFTTADVTGSNSTGYYQSGLIQDLNIQTDNYPDQSSVDCTLPGQSSQDCSHITIIMQGYFYANQTGTYQLIAAETDKLFVAWIGSDAYSTWNDANYAAKVPFYSTSDPAQPVITAVAGEFVPVTFAWVNGYNSGALTFYIFAPDGSVFTDSSSFFVPPCPESPFVA